MDNLNFRDKLLIGSAIGLFASTIVLSIVLEMQ
jgi:hypothetical protein